MDRSDVCTLIQDAYTSGGLGIRTKTEVKSEIFCSVRSVSMTEYSQAGQLGIKPMYIFEVYDFEYSGQQEVEYKEVRYSVYRVYRKQNGILQLYVQKKAGVSNVE